MNNCDIIIPIYNAYDCLKPCIDSVIKNTDLKNNRIILIDDKSPDERVLPLLRKYHNGKTIILLENEENKGFVGTVNKGMKYSDTNDVLLLNSDTEVSKDWLKNIKECAYSGPLIATVTPLSNNASIVSVPEGLKRNELPKNMTYDEYAELISNISYKDYPELPTGHGFCLYIKREALNEVGFFDEETFKKGYGEENDFCFRCLDKGYRHLLCDNVLIYHKEAQSFGKDKKQMVEQNQQLLRQKHEYYLEQTFEWFKEYPIDYICQNIKYGICLSNKKPNILYLFDNYNEIEINSIKDNLIDNYNIHILVHESNGYKLYSFFDEYRSSLYMNCKNKCTKINIYNSSYKQMINKLVDNLQISLIHIIEFRNHYYDIKEIAKENNINLFITINDNFINLINEDKDQNYKKMWIKELQLLLNDSKIFIDNNTIKNEFSIDDKNIIKDNNYKNIYSKYSNNKKNKDDIKDFIKECFIVTESIDANTKLEWITNSKKWKLINSIKMPKRNKK